MRFGLIMELSVPRPWHPTAEKDVYENALEQIRLCETLGFDQVWCVEHHFMEEYSHSSCPDMFLTAAAMQTKRMRLGFGIATCLPQLVHPARVAERTAFLDVLSGGRVDVGTGRSSTWTEMAGFGINIDETKKYWDEYVRCLPKMWMQERFSHDGYSFSMPERAILPKPIQKPHPPLWVAVTSPGTELDAARYGMGCLVVGYGDLNASTQKFDRYRQEIKHCEPVGAFVNEQIAAVNFLYCHEDDAYALKRGQQLVAGFGSAAAQTVEIKQAFPSSNYSTLGLLGKLRADPDAPDAGKNVPDSLCLGGPKRVTEVLKRWESAGLDSVVFIVNFLELLQQSEVLDSLRLFAREVMPHFAEPGTNPLHMGATS